MSKFDEFINTYINIQNAVENDIKKKWPKAYVYWNDYTWFDLEDRELIVYYSKEPCKCGGSCNDDQITYSFDKIRELLNEV